MPVKISRPAVFIFLHMALLQAAVAQQEQRPDKKKLAVLRIEYDAFSPEDKELVDKALNEQLSQEGRITVISEAEVRQKLITLGIKPSEIDSQEGYIQTGQILQVDYVLVGSLDKIGDFVEVTFRVFTMPRGSQKQYPGGKTLEILVREEIPKMVKNMYNDMDLTITGSEQKVRLPVARTEPGPSKKKPPWKLIALGGVASSLVTAFIIVSGEGSAGAGDEGLPIPPVVPKAIRTEQ